MIEATARVTITHPTGLHARPAVTLTKLAKTFASSIRVRPLPEGAWVDAKSVVRVMALKCRTGTELELAAEGDDAQAALDALTALIRRDFDEVAA